MPMILHQIYTLDAGSLFELRYFARDLEVTNRKSEFPIAQKIPNRNLAMKEKTVVTAK